MSAPSTLSLSVELLSRTIDVKYGCFVFEDGALLLHKDNRASARGLEDYNNGTLCFQFSIA